MSVFVHLYDISDKTLNTGEIKDYLVELFPKINVDIRDEFIPYHNVGHDSSNIASALASIRVANPERPFSINTPLYGEIEYEKRVLAGGASGGILYDGYELSSIYHSMLPGGECTLDHIHVVFTNRLFGTFDEDDLRYHARVSICSTPSIISATGIVEAPAKPREYYMLKKLNSNKPLVVADLKKKFVGEFIDYDDPRITEVAKGYVMQALVYLLAGEAFCENRECRLFNAHWQKEMICAQLSGNKFCRHHQTILKHLNEKINHND